MHREKAMGSRRQKEEKRKTVSRDEVITKLKDDGDFDNLRLSIIHKLRDDEELRNSVVSIVRKSTVLNRPGAENMKVRQLSDAIYDEVRSEVMNNISDGVWKIIRSSDGMKNEITETVQSVYNKLVDTEKKEVDESSAHAVVRNADDNKGNKGALKASVPEDGNLSDVELQEPPGFSLSSNHQNHHETKEELRLNMHSRETGEEQKQGPNHSKDMLESDDVDPGAPPGFSADAEHEQPCDGSDEDPEVPPGFG